LLNFVLFISIDVRWGLRKESSKNNLGKRIHGVKYLADLTYFSGFSFGSFFIGKKQLLSCNELERSSNFLVHIVFEGGAIITSPSQ